MSELEDPVCSASPAEAPARRVPSTSIRRSTVTDRVMVFVDAGYIWHVMTTFHKLTRIDDLTVAYQPLAEFVRTQIEDRVGPVLRVRWYDGIDPTDGSPTPGPWAWPTCQVCGWSRAISSAVTVSCNRRQSTPNWSPTWSPSPIRSRSTGSSSSAGTRTWPLVSRPPKTSASTSRCVDRGSRLRPERLPRTHRPRRPAPCLQRRRPQHFHHGHQEHRPQDRSGPHQHAEPNSHGGTAR